MQRLKAAIKRNHRLARPYGMAYNLYRMIKKRITKGAYMDWSYLVIDAKKVSSIVMQKVACTSIKASMIGFESDKDYHTLNREMRTTGYVRSKLDPVAQQGYFVFTFVRNPFQRLISCYENKYHTDAALRAAGKYDCYLLGYIAKDRGFRRFARRVCRIPDRLSDHHFVSQSFLIDRMGQNPKPDFVGHFERLAEEYEPIREKYGFMPLPHHNKTPKKASWMDYYDLPTAKMVYKRYRQDIERYGYQQTYEQLIAYLQNRDAS